MCKKVDLVILTFDLFTSKLRCCITRGAKNISTRFELLRSSFLGLQAQTDGRSAVRIAQRDLRVGIA